MGKLRFSPLVLLIAGAAACGNHTGCTCLGPVPNGFPPTERHPNAVQAQLTNTGALTLDQRASDLLSQIGFTGVFTTDMPSTCNHAWTAGPCQGTYSLCCNVPAGTCPLQVDLTSHAGDPGYQVISLSGGTLSVTQQPRVKSLTAFPLHIALTSCGGIPTNITADYQATGDTTLSGAPYMEATISLPLTPDADAGTLRAAPVGSGSGIDPGDISVTGPYASYLEQDMAILMADALGRITSQSFADKLDQSLCRPCEVDPNCAPFGHCSGDVCVMDGVNDTTPRCLQEIGFTGRAQAVGALGSLAPKQPGAIDLYEVAASQMSTASGVWLGFLSGTLPVANARNGTTHDPCVPDVAAPTPPTIDPIPELTAGAIPGTSTPYDLGIGIHQYQLDLAAWSAYESGAMCLDVDQDTVPALSSSALVPLLPSLDDLLHGQTVPLRVSVRPNAPPTLTIGDGTDDAHPLLQVSFTAADVDVAAVIDQRYVRIFTAQVTFGLPLRFDIDADGRLVPVTGAGAATATTISVSNSELLTEAPDEIAGKVQPLLALLLPSFVADLDAIDVPAFLDLRLAIAAGGVQPSAARDAVLLFGSLAPAATSRAPVHTEVSLAGVDVPPTATFAAHTLDGARAPRAHLRLGGLAAGGGALEWQSRVDGGMWTPFARDAAPALESPSFWLQGHHRVEVRAREAGHPETLDPVPAAVDVLVDTIAPRLTAAREGDVVHIAASDLVTSEAQLAIGYRAGDAWHWQTGVTDVPAEVDGALVVELRAVDEAGNQTSTSIDLQGAAAPAPTGCNAGGATGAPLALAIALLLAWRPARRRGARAAAVLVALAGCGHGGSGGADGGTGDGGGPPAPGPVGRWASLATNGGHVVVAAYDDHYGDLVYGEVTNGSPTWEVVDGLPDTPAVDPSEYRGGLTDPGPDVGLWTSVALVGGAPEIAYSDAAQTELRFAAKTASGWVVHTVDQVPAGQLGMFARMVVDASGVPSIAYMTTAIPSGGSFVSQLRWAHAHSATPMATTDWDIATVATEGISCGGLCATGQVCLASGACATPDDTCTPACTGGPSCVSGTCVTSIGTSPDDGLPEGTGLFAAPVITSSGPVIVYYDHKTEGLHLAVPKGAGWSESVLDESAANDDGRWATAAVDSTGAVDIAYYDAVARDLHYTSWTGAAQPDQIVDDGTRPGDRPHDVGAGAAITVDAADRPVVVYQDADNGDVIEAKDSALGWSTTPVLTGHAAGGFYTSIARDPTNDQIWMATYVYNRDDASFEHLLVTKL